MPLPLRGEKASSDIVNETAENMPPPNTGMALPSMGEGEMSRHELWNEAGLSARAYRRRHLTPCLTPAPISIPEHGSTPSVLSSADLSTSDTIPPATGTRRRWGFFSSRHPPQKQDTEKKSPSTLETLCATAHSRLRKRIRCAKSAPNLGSPAAPLKRGAQPAMPRPVEAVPNDASASSPRTSPPPSEPTTLLQGEVDKNAIYFAVDPTWRISQGSVRFQFITPVPTSPTFLGRPDSPLLHRHYSLDQLSFAAQEVSKTLTAMGIPVIYPGDDPLHPIDELHAYLEP